ncbi:hypothetical protein [Apibacter sp. HY039]|uniref:hypothetical protein n=1 Tax=Apibacter sp. HY039 TaxID=2501476 RepID=UPI000FEB6867|nr:hypothetical protein [Apibacter sp. HY039]
MHKYKKLVNSLLLFLLSSSLTWVYGQTDKKNAHKKGEFYAYWGWNRAYYGRSSVHFTGNDYNFTLHGVKGDDKPIGWNFNDFLNPGRITIPQVNYRIGYFFKDNWAISLGMDHMKYVVRPGQWVKATGSIERPGYENQIVEGESTYLTDEFLHLEHTDGLNYLNVELEYYHNFIKAGFFKLNGIAGAGIGAVIPKTNATLMDKDRHDKFHLAGYGVDAKVGAELLFWKIFFLRTELKEGFIGLPDIRTSSDKSDKASQNILYLQWNYTFGVSWHF